MKEIDVFCADTDVLVLLMDLVANGYHGPMTKLNFVKTGKKGSSGKDVIDVIERVQSIGMQKARGMIGLHNFSGADWGGKYVGITKET